jgi:ABC-2 type transport system permease protein
MSTGAMIARGNASVGSGGVGAGVGLGAFGALLRREIVRFLRQPSRVIGTLGTVVMIWIVLGSGFAGSFMAPLATGDEVRTLPYSAYVVPGMAAMVVLFTSIVAAISLIDDRHAGFLQSVLVSPAPAWAVVGSKVAGCALLAVAQGALVLVASPLAGVPLTAAGFVLGLVALGCIALGIGGIGLALAWKIDSVQGFHGVMNLVMMPMWLLSGAFFPVASSAGWLRWVMLLNPMTWATEALRGALLRDGAGSGGGGALGPELAWAGAAAFAAMGVAMPWVVMRRAMKR